MSLQDIYKKAGVVMKPAAMKDGKLYSQQPHSGAGDFNFSRADGVQTRINKHGLIETVADNEPRLSYSIVDGKVSDCPHLLLEPQRTNGLPYSLEYDNNTYYTKTNSTITTQSGVSPDGSNTAYKLQDTNDSTATSHYIQQASGYRATITYNDIKSGSVFVKAGTKSQVQVRLVNGLGSFSYIMGNFDLETETISTGASANASNISYELQNYGNGWYRCIVKGSWTISNVTQTALQVFIADSSLAASPNMHNYQGDGTGNLFVWGQMIESGSYATSYIPTSGSSEQRQDDICNGSGNSETFNDSEGVLFAEIEALSDYSSFKFISMSDGSTSNRVSLFYSTSNTLNASVNGISSIGSGAVITDNNKIAFRYKSGDYALFLNGAKVGSSPSTSGNHSGLDRVNFDFGQGSDDWHGKCRELSVFKEALTDEQLQLLTTP